MVASSLHARQDLAEGRKERSAKRMREASAAPATEPRAISPRAETFCRGVKESPSVKNEGTNTGEARTTMPFFTANDGVKLHYVKREPNTQSPDLPPIVLIHGWSGSHKYFALNMETLSAKTAVYALDLRHHGDSEKPPHGFHVARFSADLRDFILELKLAWPSKRPLVLGSSLGCAVLWSFVELYGTAEISKMVFVDQAPSQWKLPDWTFGSKGIYDAASLANIQRAVSGDMSAFADGNAECCLRGDCAAFADAALMSTLKDETLKCKPEALCAIMADHAPKDWRPILPRIDIPCLNLYGTKCAHRHADTMLNESRDRSLPLRVRISRPTDQSYFASRLCSDMPVASPAWQLGASHPKVAQLWATSSRIATLSPSTAPTTGYTSRNQSGSPRWSWSLRKVCERVGQSRQVHKTGAPFST
jgi:non-heme chloroperoxidase